MVILKQRMQLRQLDTGLTSMYQKLACMKMRWIASSLKCYPSGKSKNLLKELPWKVCYLSLEMCKILIFQEKIVARLKTSALRSLKRHLHLSFYQLVMAMTTMRIYLTRVTNWRWMKWFQCSSQSNKLNNHLAFGENKVRQIHWYVSKNKIITFFR